MPTARSSCSIRRSSASREVSSDGVATLSSATSRLRRGSSPSRIAATAAESESIAPISCASPIPFACSASRSGWATVTVNDSGTSPVARATSSWRRWAIRSRANWPGSRPERDSRSTASSAARASPEASASVVSKSSSASAAPSSSTTSSVATFGPPKATSWSRVPSASRKLPDADARDQRDGAVVDLDLLGVGDPADHLGDLLERGALEVEALAAIDDRRHHLLRLGGGEDEDGVRRRLLERLQEGVPGLLGEHVGLVEDVDLPASRPPGRSRPARGARGRRRRSGWRRRPSRSRRARCRRRSSGRARTRRTAPGSGR